MEESILKSIKKRLNLAADYTPFDEDVLMEINSAFADLAQIGLGPVDGFHIEDDTYVWDDFVTVGVPPDLIQSVRTYVFLRARLVFDPPQTSFGITAMEKQIEKLEWRLNVAREYALHPVED